VTSAEHERRSGLSYAATIALVVIFGPYFIKHVFLVGTPGVVEWLVWDYSVRCISLLGIVLYCRNSPIGKPPRIASIGAGLAFFVLASLSIFLLSTYMGPELGRALPYLGLFQTPLIKDHDLLIFDLTIGIALVALSEDLAFRQVIFAVLRRLSLNEEGVIFLSALFFGFVHLTSSVANMRSAFFGGLLLGAVFSATGRLSICVILHYVGDFLFFGRRAVAAYEQVG
jgi:uncharacterized protein